MSKLVKAVAPYNHQGSLNFKTAPYNAWLKAGGPIAPSHYPCLKFHGLAFRYELPTLFKNKKEARFRFVEPVSIFFDTFPDYARYELIPMIWDCWPPYFEKTCKWLKKHNVKSAIFTSSITADRVKNIIPDLNILTVTEGIDTAIYNEGEVLEKRSVNLYEIGGKGRNFFLKHHPEDYLRLNHYQSLPSHESFEDFRNLLADTKVTVIFPKCVTEPEIAGDVETLTQRYWECMLSRIVMVGHAPKELADLIGYNPVIELDRDNAVNHVESILKDISNPFYQKMVNKNREVALQMAPWEIRIKQIMQWLTSLGYEI